VPLALLPPATAAGDPPAVNEGLYCREFPTPSPKDPFTIALVPTANADGASGEAKLTFAQSPFGIAVTPAGHHLYDITVATDGLRSTPGVTYVAWAVTPTLAQTAKLGPLDAEGETTAQVAFNKFLVFVTAETSPDVDRWTGPIVLRGISRSGRLHTMLGHGPFEGEPC
jgi:hypothetical protein